jgi:hypothetical protein
MRLKVYKGDERGREGAPMGAIGIEPRTSIQSKGLQRHQTPLKIAFAAHL